jgi:hypothetical protein
MTGSATTTLARPHWAKELESFTEHNAGRMTILEIDEADLGAQEILTWQLRGVSYDHANDEVEIMFGGFVDPGQHMTHVIRGVIEIDLLTSSSGTDEALRVATAQGQTLLRLSTHE